jgi:S1 RNA binding domain protein
MQSKIGEIYDGKVTGVTNFGAFVKLSNGESGMVHISEVAPVYVKDIHEFISEGQDVRVKVLAVNENNKISLSIKQTQESSPAKPAARAQQGDNTFKKRPARPSAPADFQKKTAPAGPMSFEDMMSKFKADSEEKLSDLKRFSDVSRKRGNR